MGSGGARWANEPGSIVVIHRVGNVHAFRRPVFVESVECQRAERCEGDLECREKQTCEKRHLTYTAGTLFTYLVIHVFNCESLSRRGFGNGSFFLLLNFHVEDFWNELLGTLLFRVSF